MGNFFKNLGIGRYAITKKWYDEFKNYLGYPHCISITNDGIIKVNENMNSYTIQLALNFGLPPDIIFECEFKETCRMEVVLKNHSIYEFIDILNNQVISNTYNTSIILLARAVSEITYIIGHDEEKWFIQGTYSI